MATPPSALTLETLRKAAALLRTGRHAPAQQLLGDVLLTSPDLVEAHWLLANSCSAVGDIAGAQLQLQTCMRLAPHQPEAYVALGRLLAANNQAEAAERVLREALQVHAGVAAVGPLARLLLLQNRAGEARVLLEPSVRGDPAAPELLTLYGYALMALGRKAEAAATFARIVQAQPDNQEARFQLAAVLADDGQPIAAEAAVRAGIARGGKTPDAAFVLGRALMGQGRFAEAEAELLQVVRTQPAHVTAQGNLSELVWMRSGDLDAASAELDAALRANPRLSTLRIAKARLLLAAQQPPRALAVIDAGLAGAGSDLVLLDAAAQIALDIDAARALDYAQRAVQVAPEDHAALVALGNAALAAGNARQALEVSGKLSRRDPDDGQALTIRVDAWRLLGDDRHRTLADYAGFVRAGLIDTPAGWPDLPAYLADLVCAIERLHTLHVHPIGQSLRGGGQVPLRPEHSPDAAVRAFPQAVDGPIRRYMAALGSGDDALRRRNTGRYRLHSAWSVRLRPDGFHVNHYHPQGWLSSACYLRLPPAVGSRNGEGWLQFGEPAFPTLPRLGAEYFLKPEPGLLALFPSYMWHGTAPFSGGPEDSRLTIAFDVVPA